MNFRELAYRRYREQHPDRMNDLPARDYMLDVLEHLADAYNASHLALGRGVGIAAELKAEIEEMGEDVFQAWRDLPPSLKGEEERTV